MSNKGTIETEIELVAKKNCCGKLWSVIWGIVAGAKFGHF